MAGSSADKIIRRTPLTAGRAAIPPSEEDAAALRQFSLQRLMGYSVEYSDATELRAFVEAGMPWKDAAVALAEQRIGRADHPDAPLLSSSRNDLLLRASALFRMAQMMMLSDSPERFTLYRRAAELFAEALHGRCERISIPTAAGSMAAWSLSPDDSGPRPGVLIVGGIEGWAMDLLGLGQPLAERGLNVLMLDGPGQGETRFEYRHYLDRDWPAAYGAAIDTLLDMTAGAPVGVLGNSVGGGVAMLLAGRDRRVAACCNNGGLLVPLRQRERKGFFPKVEAFCGPASAAEIEEIWEDFEITAERMSLTCPLLIVQGGLDPLVSVEDSAQMLEWAGSADKQMVVFDDGDHCIYNHPADKLALVGDWFASRLAGAGA